MSIVLRFGIAKLTVPEQHFWILPFVRPELPLLPRRQDANDSIPACQLGVAKIHQTYQAS